MSKLFSPLKIRDITLRNRIGMSPMCMYSSDDGFANEWHKIHYGSRALGGAALVMTEATAISPDGRISPDDLGIWKDAHLEGLSGIARAIRDNGAVPAIQLAHSGRKGSGLASWKGSGMATAIQGGWGNLLAPSAIAFNDEWQVPQEMTQAQIEMVKEAFVDAASRALDAGFELVEVHAAHGYLLHEFLSPLSNKRSDEYGGSFENRTRLVRATVAAVREIWPERLPLAVRFSVTDWVEGGWDPEQSVELAKVLKELGADLIDCSSGALVPGASIPVGPGYQVPFAEQIRRDAHIATAAVGLITDARQAERIVAEGQADVVLLGRALLREMSWPYRAAKELGVPVPYAQQYHRA